MPELEITENYSLQLSKLAAFKEIVLDKYNHEFIKLIHLKTLKYWWNLVKYFPDDVLMV